MKQIHELLGYDNIKIIQDDEMFSFSVDSMLLADFIKTSTGFSKGGATREDIALFAANIGENVRMKAAGGIRSFEDAEDYLNLGCERLGTSAIVKLVKNQEVSGY